MKKLLSTLFFLALAVAVLLYATGTFQGEQVAPGKAPAPPGEKAPAGSAQAETVEVTVHEYAVGTVASRTRVAVAAQVTARVLSVAAEAGAPVTAEKELVVLDDRQLQARLQQAREGLAAAVAARDRARQAKLRGDALLTQARKSFDRVKGLLADRAATPEQMEAAEAGFLQAEAGVADAVAAIAAAEAGIQGAKQVVTEAEVAVGHATIPAPITGVVAERSVEPSDLAWPGRTLLVVLDPKALRLEAQVREGLISRIQKGDNYVVEIPAAKITVQGTVAELIPSANPQSRTFRVRVDLEQAAGLHPGMFGRMRLSVGKRTVVRVPASAVVRVGQLETVLVREGERWARRLVTTGPSLEGNFVEVLSGLTGDEIVGLPEVR